MVVDISKEENFPDVFDAYYPTIGILVTFSCHITLFNQLWIPPYLKLDIKRRVNQYKGMIFWSLVFSLKWFGHMQILCIENFSAYFFLSEGVEIFI